MMKTVQIKPTTPADVEELIANIRPEDAAEIRYGGEDVRPAIESSVRESTACFSVRIDGDLVYMYGVARYDILCPRACVWSLGTVHFMKHKKDILKLAGSGMEDLFGMFPDCQEFYNRIPASYGGYIRWAQRYFGAEFTSTDSTHYRYFVIHRKEPSWEPQQHQ